MKIEDINLVKINGGGVSATFLQQLSVIFKTVYGIGQEVGGAIRRLATGKICPL